MLVCLLIDVDMLSAFPYYGLANKVTLNVESKCHNFIWASMRENLPFWGWPLGSLISAFLFAFWERIICKLATGKIIIF